MLAAIAELPPLRKVKLELYTPDGPGVPSTTFRLLVPLTRKPKRGEAVREQNGKSGLLAGLRKTLQRGANFTMLVREIRVECQRTLSLVV